MEKLISVLIVLIFVLTACSSQNKPIDQSETNESDSNSSSEPVPSEPEIDYEYYNNLPKTVPENEFDQPSGYDDEPEFNFEVPDIAATDIPELPYIFENPEWCVNGTDWIQKEEKLFTQYLCSGEEANELAKAIALLNCHRLPFNSGIEPFHDISEANEKGLLWAAILRTPTRRQPEDENHPFNITLDAGSSVCGYQLFPSEIYSVSDVEKTFRYLFGEEPDFVPQNIPMLGIRYFEEFGIIVQFFDGIMISQDFPQIISYSENDGVYTVKTISAFASHEGPCFYFKLTDGSYEFFPLNEENSIIASQILNPSIYTFEKAKDGHFVLTGFSYG